MVAVKDVTDQLSPCMEPATLEETTKVQFCCFDFGSVTVTCHLPHTGFSLRGNIPLCLHIDNQTTTTVWVNTFLCREDTYTASRGHKKVQNKHVSNTISSRVPAGALQSFKGRSLKVPEDVQETLKSCLCINMEYSILMRVLAQTGTGMVMKLPLYSRWTVS